MATSEVEILEVDKMNGEGVYNAFEKSRPGGHSNDLESIDELMNTLARDEIEAKIIKAILDRSVSGSVGEQGLDAVQRAWLQELERSVYGRTGIIKTTDELMRALKLRNEQNMGASTNKNGQNYPSNFESSASEGPIDDEKTERFVQSRSAVNSGKEATRPSSVESSVLNGAEFQSELLNGLSSPLIKELLNGAEFKKEAFTELQKKLGLKYSTHAELVMVFFENNNAAVTKAGMIQLLEQRGLSRGSAKRIVSAEIGAGDRPKNPVFIIASQDPLTGDIYYRLDPAVFEEVKEIVHRHLVKLIRNMEEEQVTQQEIDEWVKKAYDYLGTHKIDEIKAMLVEKPTKELVIDWPELNSLDPELAWLVHNRPERALEVFDTALKMVLFDDLKQEDDPGFFVTFRDVGTKVLRVSDVSDEYFLKMVTVRALVVSVPQERRHFYEKVVYVCKDCGNEMVRVQTFLNRAEFPRKCDACGSYRIDPDPERSVTRDVTIFTLQDINEDLPANEQPRKISAYALRWIKGVLPGDKVKITAIVRDNLLATKEKKHTAKFVLEIVHVDILEPREVGKLSDEDIRRLKDLVNKYKKKLPYVVARSIAPHVVGWDAPKLAVALALASAKEITPSGFRKYIHVLLLGDRGVAKSQIIKDANKIIRGVYQGGKGLTVPGVTATVTRDELTGDWVYQGGALIKAHRSVLFIDEADKIRDDVIEALHIPMENGDVPVAKATVVMNLTAHTSVVAAANPKGSRILPNKPIFDQIPFSLTFLDRFDIIFIMRLDMDDEIIDRVAEAKKKVVEGELEREIDIETLRKLFHYAQLIDVSWTDQAWKEMVSFVKMVNRALREANFSYSFRLMDMVIRLAEAFARLRLSEKVEVHDVKAIEQLLVETIKSWGSISDDTGNGDVDWTILGEIEQKARMEELKQLEDIEEILKELHEMIGERIKASVVYEVLEERFGWERAVAEEKLKKAVERGYIHKEVKDGVTYYFLSKYA